jgi:PKD-like domain
MFRSMRLLGYLLPLALAACYLAPSNASAQMRRVSDREFVINAPPSLSLTSDASVIKACSEGEGPRVHLNANAKSPGGFPIRYRWSTPAGRIIGEGANVVWDLAGVAPGYYKASLEIETGDSNSECQAFASTGVLINACPIVTPVCPEVSVVCPSQVALDQPLTFTANVAGGNSTTPLTYNWTVSAGTIIEGQGTPTIKVDTTGLAGQTVRATLSMGGLPMECADSCAVSIPLPPPQCRKFDEFPDVARNDEKARLDNFVVELQNDPTSTGYVIVSPGRSEKAEDAQRRMSRIVDYLVNSRGVDAKRVVTLVGSNKAELTVELWACPQGVTPTKR